MRLPFLPPPKRKQDTSFLEIMAKGTGLQERLETSLPTKLSENKRLRNSSEQDKHTTKDVKKITVKKKKQTNRGHITLSLAAQLQNMQTQTTPKLPAAVVTCSEEGPRF